MKILYVEDELSKNIPKIIQLFSDLLSSSIVKRLNEMENDENGYGAEPQEIKEIVELSGVIDVEYKFSAALDKVINYHKNYSLFIIDRNLSSEDYNTKLITEIDSDFDDNLLSKYNEREGDYLFHKLVSKGIDVSSQFYFLTAYISSELSDAEEIFGLIDRKTFKENNFIEKGNSESTRELINKINNIEIFKLQWENKVFLDILRTNVGNKIPYKFIDLMKNKDKKDSVSIFQNLVLIRNIFENIVSDFAKIVPDHNCWNPKNKTQLSMWPFIAWIKNYSKEKNECDYRHNANSIIASSLSSIWSIASDFGDHDKSQSDGFLPTSNTVNALVCELKDIILWFESILE